VSKTWFHGGERRRMDDGSNDRYWRCSHCKHKRYLKISEEGLVEEGTYSTTEGLGGSELCGNEVDSFNSRVSGKVISNGNGNASTARAKFVHNGVRITHFTDTSGSTVPFPNPEIYPASYPRGPSPPSP